MRRFVLSLARCYFVLVFVRPLTCLGKRELILVLFVRLFNLRLIGFVYFLFLLVSGGRLRLVIVALPGLFPYLFGKDCWRYLTFENVDDDRRSSDRSLYF